MFLLAYEVNISSLLVYFFGGGGIIGGTLAFLKYRREADSVIAEASKTSVAAADIVLKNLREEVIRLGKIIETRDTTIAELSTQLKDEITKAKEEVIAAIR